MNWTVKTGKHRGKPDEDGNPTFSCFATLLYMGREVHSVEGVTAEASLNKMAEKWNAENYTPDMSNAHIRCLADVNKGFRERVLKEWGENENREVLNRLPFQ